ncbi:MAG: hypothetical protein JRF59_02100 [Deltaproteobacteria bacterium]|nr:hypothetical protein [Deltaproteobacteria bacterium]MBW1923338.1 hypothetical protein [Deltaproteobacteria bacterium]MBW1949552.1 hypothetical protein [Deltaproteobacteria bacterium]MBW2007504.1 hypothetical protein [Deltaproteobacteria bacterium]MBW2102434.1 hypothetical protein [Deltaproteobacteria bacterium]
METLDDSLERWFQIPPIEGEDKVCSASEAIERHIRPGMSIHIAATHSRAYGLLYELIRKFWGKDPGFEFITMGVTGPCVALVHGGLGRSYQTTFIGDPYPTPGPNPIYQEAFRTQKLFLRHWSILTFTLRLKAGAMDMAGYPTRSLLGSTMEKENAEDFRVVEDFFGDERPTGVLRPLNPDISLIHGWVSDRNGNVLFTPPYGEGFYGAMASREGTVVSVERIVSTDFIRRHNNLIKIPGSLVRCVVPIAMGSHPSGLSSQGIPEMESYADDYDFLEDMRKASRDPERLDAWIRHWILEPETRSAYLGRLGKDRIGFLKGKARGDSWYADILELAAQVDWKAPPNAQEKMIMAAAKMMARRCLENGYRHLLAGVGAANLASWLALRRLKESGHDAEVMAEIGFYGYAPRPADPFIFNYRNMPTCKMLSDVETIMGQFVSGSDSRTLGAIGAGQVDRWGRVNSTLMEGDILLVGSGGANDVASGAEETLVVCPQEKYRFPQDVHYVTSPGENVRTVVSDMGVFQKERGRQTLRLTAVLGTFSGNELDERVREIKQRCGWDLEVGEPLETLAVDDAEFLEMLRLYDPKRQFLGKIRTH